MDSGAVPFLQTLKERLTEIPKFFDPSRRIVYIDYPLHLNIGDLLINLGTEAMFQAFSLNVWRRYCLTDCPKIIPGLREDDVILLHGGGNFGDIWEHHQMLRERILRTYPRNRTVILPQTVHFQSSAKQEAALDLISRHGNLHVFARDRNSLTTLSAHKGIDCSLMPDLAHFLYPFRAGGGAGLLPRLMLVRKDREKSGVRTLSPHEADQPVDWDSLISLRVQLAYKATLLRSMAYGFLGTGRETYPVWYPIRDRAVESAIVSFERYGSIYTDRLHGVILGLLMGKTVTTNDNSYGKLSSYISAWLLGAPGLNQNADVMEMTSALKKDPH